MATSSIFRDVRIKDSKHIRRLIRALERSKSSNVKRVTLSKKCEDMTKEQIHAMFGEKK